MILSQGQIIAGRYEIVEKIGQGGMSIVYKAKDLRLGRSVTFKVLKEEHLADDEFVERFKSEAGAVAALSHPNIVNVYDVGQENNINYIVMEYINGVTLKELIVKNAPFKDKEIYGVAIQIADALSHAHKNGIIHRDIKPQNVLVSNNGVIKVMDFGIARTVNSDTITVGGSTMGSVHYFSPEQAKGSVVSFQSDLYSLGIVMFEMAAGRLPFDSKESVSVALMHINDPIPDLKTINPAISDGLARVIKKLTQKKPSARYASADELAYEMKRMFVNPSAEDDFSPSEGGKSDTIVITQQQLDRIRDELERGPEDSENKPLFDDYEDDFDLDQELRYEFEDDSPKSSKKQEVLLVIAALLTSFVIIAVALYFLVPMLQNQVNPTDQATNSSNSGLVKLPDFRGTLIEGARESADALGFKITIVREDYSEKDAGTVLDQNYDPDVMLEKGTEIGVIVSKGNEKTKVGRFVNLDYDEAYDLAQSLYLYVSPVYEYSETVPRYTVMNQSIEQGTEVDAGTEIILTVSKGPEIKMTRVPNILDLSEDDAKTALSAAKLTIGSITKGESSKYAAGRIMSQSIEYDREVEEGTIVSFVVCSGPPPETPQPSPEVTTKNLIIRYDVPENLSVVNISIKKKTATDMVEIYNGDHTRDDFPLTIPVTGEGTVEFILYVDGIEMGSQVEEFSR